MLKPKFIAGERVSEFETVPPELNDFVAVDGIATPSTTSKTSLLSLGVQASKGSGYIQAKLSKLQDIIVSNVVCNLFHLETKGDFALTDDELSNYLGFEFYVDKPMFDSEYQDKINVYITVDNSSRHKLGADSFGVIHEVVNRNSLGYGRMRLRYDSTKELFFLEKAFKRSEIIYSISSGTTAGMLRLGGQVVDPEDYPLIAKGGTGTIINAEGVVFNARATNFIGGADSHKSDDGRTFPRGELYDGGLPSWYFEYYDNINSRGIYGEIEEWDGLVRTEISTEGVSLYAADIHIHTLPQKKVTKITQPSTQAISRALYVGEVYYNL